MLLFSFLKDQKYKKGSIILSMTIKNNIAFNNPTNETIKQLVNFYNEGQLSVVVERALSLAKKYPGAYIIWNILGAAHKSLGQVELASEAFKKVTELNPNYADGFNNLGVVLKDQGKFDKALEAFQKKQYRLSLIIVKLITIWVIVSQLKKTLILPLNF